MYSEQNMIEEIVEQTGTEFHASSRIHWNGTSKWNYPRNMSCRLNVLSRLHWNNEQDNQVKFSDEYAERIECHESDALEHGERNDLLESENYDAVEFLKKYSEQDNLHETNSLKRGNQVEFLEEYGEPNGIRESENYEAIEFLDVVDVSET